MGLSQLVHSEAWRQQGLVTMGLCQDQEDNRDCPGPHCLPVPASPSGTWPTLGAVCPQELDHYPCSQAAAGWQFPWSTSLGTKHHGGTVHCWGDKELREEGPQAMGKTRSSWMGPRIHTSPQSLSPPAASPAFVTHWAGCECEHECECECVCAQSPPPNPLPAASAKPNLPYK